MGAWSRVWSLSWRERRLLAAALAVQPAVVGSLRLVGFRRTCALLRRTSPEPGGAPARTTVAAGQGPAAETTETVQMVAAAARRGVPRATCLTRSLTLWWLLRWQGVASDLRIGTRQAGGEFEAHAWLERDGVVLNDRPDVAQNFIPFAGDDLVGAFIS